MLNRSIDEKIILNAQQGDQNSISELIRICNVDARKYAKFHCNLNDVEDATQESLFIVSKNISHLKSAKSFAFWLYTIVKRECHRALRKSYLLSKLHGADRFDELRDSETKILLNQALSTLSEDKLKIIIMSDFLEISILEIAQELNESTSAIKSKLHRIRVELRQFLSK